MRRDWKGQKVLIIGAARQGLALARFLSGEGAAVILNDQRSPEMMQEAVITLANTQVRWVLGSHPLEVLDGVDLVCVSGGVPLTLPILVEAQRRGLALTNDSQIFMEAVSAAVTGITGSAGKTTTTTLVGRMARSYAANAGLKAWVGGNIGLPLVEYLDEIQPGDPVIVEFSSFQLELMTSSPHIAAVLNVTPNHLDRHGTFEAYAAAKARILDFQSTEDTAVLSREDPGSWAMASQVKGKLFTFGAARPANSLPGTYVEDDTLVFRDGQQLIELMPTSAIRLRGRHNLLNVLAACAVGLAAGFPVETLRTGVEGFNGVEHRLEWVSNYHGANWYNNTIATAPERTIAAIDSFDEPLILLLGGRDKNLPWDRLANLIHRRVDHVIVFGEAADKIMGAIQDAAWEGSRLHTVTRYAGLHDAVKAAATLAQPGDVVLLSPGGTSFDEFKDFEERGERFREWVKELL